MRVIISQGATTILVSHSLNQIRDLCNKVLWLDHGKQIAFGDCQEICDQYQKYLDGEIGLPEPVKQETQENAPNACQKGGVDTCPPKRKRLGLKAITACLIASLFFGAMMGTIIQKIAPQRSPEMFVTITAKPDTGSVTFRGASVDGTWYSPTDILISNDGWVEDTAQLTYTATSPGPIVIELPDGQKRELTFNVGPNEGTAIVSCGDQTQQYVLRQDTALDLGYGYEIPTVKTSEQTGFAFGAVFGVFLFILFVSLCRFKGT